MKTKIIAEIASSHNGNLILAKKMIMEAAKSGVDIVKFQSWQAKNVKNSDPDKKRYEKYELPDRWHPILKKECEKNGVEFLTTICDVGRIPFLRKLGLNKIKVSSTDCKDLEFLRKIRAAFSEVIVSAGMSRKREIKEAVKVLKRGKFTIMHCVSIYPCPIEKANMRKLLWLKTLTPHVGYSDHCLGEEAAIGAIGMGIEYLEKHFTLDRKISQTVHSVGKGIKPITTHMIASEPETFRKISRFRDAFVKAMGSGITEIFPEEMVVREKYTGRFR